MRKSKILTEAKKNRILKKIDRNKKELRREKVMFGEYHDGRGRRYGIAELYFELNDYKKTNRYLNWFAKNFPDDVKYSFYDIGEAVTKFELGKIKEAQVATINVNSHNTYLLDLILGNDVTDQNKYEWIESEGLNWALNNLEDHLGLITPNYMTWLKEFTNKESYKKGFNKFISIKKLLKGMDVSDERSELLDAQENCIEEWKLAKV